jgi:hypothetical protein
MEKKKRKWNARQENKTGSKSSSNARNEIKNQQLVYTGSTADSAAGLRIDTVTNALSLTGRTNFQTDGQCSKIGLHYFSNLELLYVD